MLMCSESNYMSEAWIWQVCFPVKIPMLSTATNPEFEVAPDLKLFLGHPETQGVTALHHFPRHRSHRFFHRVTTQLPCYTSEACLEPVCNTILRVDAFLEPMDLIKA